MRTSKPRNIALLAGTLLLTLPMSYARKKDSAPDWVMAALQNKVSTIPDNTPAIRLLDETVLTVNNEGHAVRHIRKVTKLLNREGKEHIECSASYDFNEKITVFHGWQILSTGEVLAAKDSDFIDQGLGEGELQSSARLRSLKEPDSSTAGTIVACEFEVKERPYIREETWEIQDDIPVASTTFELILPSSYRYYTTWHKATQIRPQEISSGHLKWSIEDVPAVDVQKIPLAPSWSALAGRMYVHYGTVLPPAEDRWSDIAKWYVSLAEQRRIPTPEITAKAHELTDNQPDFMSKLDRIADYVQKNIRYFVIEMGIGGWQPHPAGDVFRNRYGDCKDKATLIVAMLSSIGIHGEYVLVDTRRGTVDADAPSIYGNHMISAIEIPAGYTHSRLQSVVRTRDGKRYLIFDPTNPYVPIGSLPNYLQGSIGLLTIENGGEVITLPVEHPAINVQERHGSFELSSDGKLQGSVTELRFENTAAYLRSLYTEEDEQEKLKVLEHRLANDFANFSVSNIQVKDVGDLSKPMSLSYQITVNGYAHSAGDALLLLRPRILSQHATPMDTKPRMVAIDMEETGMWKDSFEVRLPSAYMVDELPAPTDIDTDFLSYHSQVTASDGMLHYQREYAVKQLTLAPETYKELYRIMGRIQADENNTAVLKKK